MDIRIDEGETVTIYLRLKRRVPDGGTVSLSLVGSPTIELIVKEQLSDPDEDAKFVYSVATNEISILSDGVDADYSEIAVAVDGADQTPPGNYPWRLNVNSETVASGGYWRIKNT